MINVKTEQMEPLDSITIIGNPSRPTRYRWALKGVGEPAVILETLNIGGRKWTSREAVQRFYEAQNQPVGAAPVTTPKQRQQQSISAARELERIGC